MGRADDAGRGTAFHDAGRHLHHLCRVEDAAARLHDEQLPGQTGLAQPVAKLAYICRHRRPYIGVDDGGAAAFVFADLRQDIHGKRHEDPGQGRAQPRPDTPFMVGVRIGLQETDRDRLDARGAQRVDRRIDVGLVERRQHGTVGGDALGDLEPQVARRERRRLDVMRVVEAWDPDPAQLEHVAEPARGEQRGARALVLQDRIRGDGAAMQHLPEGLRIEAERRREFENAGDDAAGVVVRRRGQLARREPPVRQEQRDVRERATDIGGDLELRGSVHVSRSSLSLRDLGREGRAARASVPARRSEA